jgi:hypothetical protein
VLVSHLAVDAACLDEAHLQTALDLPKTDEMAVVCIPPRSTNTVRKWFVDHDLVDGVILLPDNLRGPAKNAPQ